MFVTGYDPSTKGRWHHATLHLAPHGGLLLVSYGSGSAWTDSGVHYVEVPSNVYNKAAARHLLDTAVTAGQLLEKTGGTPVYPEVWRQWLVGKRAPSDAEIKRALEKRMQLPLRTNSHVRDAIGVALYGAARQGLLSTTTSPESSVRLVDSCETGSKKAARSTEPMPRARKRRSGT